jgi:hypothetical protein
MVNRSFLKSNYENEICVICNKIVDVKNLLMCVRCHVSLHESCYDFATSINRSYNICPICNRIGCVIKFPCMNSRL